MNICSKCCSTRLDTEGNCTDCGQPPVRVHPPGSAICPACRHHAKMKYREEQDIDGPGNTVFAFMECTACGLRSREGIAFKEFKARLLAEWSPNESSSRMSAAQPTPESPTRTARHSLRAAIGSDVPVVNRPEIMYLPGRARAFGQAAFRYWPEQPIERHTFEVLCWADSERRQCAKKDAVFALINCGWKMLLPLHPNEKVSDGR